MKRLTLLLPLALRAGLLLVHAQGDKPAPVSVAPHVPATWKAGLASVVVTPDKSIWMAGYSNDYSGYIPSSRIQEEGGYEAATGWARGIEEIIVGWVREFVGGLK